MGNKIQKILIVEDDEILRSAYTTKLSIEGFEVESAVDGEEGLTKAQAREPDLILLDMLMPKMTGIEFLKAYNLKEDHPDVKVIVFSNLSMADKMKEAIELGALEFRSKYNVTPNEITKIIKDELSLS